MGSIIERIDDRIEEFGSKEAYLAFLEGGIKEKSPKEVKNGEDCSRCINCSCRIEKRAKE